MADVQNCTVFSHRMITKQWTSNYAIPIEVFAIAAVLLGFTLVCLVLLLIINVRKECRREASTARGATFVNYGPELMRQASALSYL